jgi:ribonuclease HI
MGSLQLCAGQEAGCEAALHAMKHVLESPYTDAIILVDATNAFNTLHWEVAQRNIHQLCPSIAKVLINTYHEDAQLYIQGESRASQGETTQGDPLAMGMYGLVVIPLIRKLTKEWMQ